MKVLRRPPERQAIRVSRAGADRAKKLCQAVARRKDAALKQLLPKRGPKAVEVDRKRWASALNKLSRPEFQALELACRQVGRLARKQLASLRPFVLRPAYGWTVAQEIVALNSVGIALPDPPQPSVPMLLACAIPAAVAGVTERVVCTGLGPDGKPPPLTLAAAHMTEVTRLFAVSGPSAMAALSLGGTVIPSAEKVIAFATQENAAASRFLGEQSAAEIVLTGADELLVLAEGQVDAELVVSELLAHLQRCPASVCGLVTPSSGLIRQVSALLKGRSRRATRGGARGGARGSGTVYLTQTRTLDEAVELANDRGPEHLWLMVARPGEVSNNLSSYAVLHVGVNASPLLAEGGLSVGLSVAGGPSPRGPVGVADFVRLTTVHELVPQSYTRLGRALATLARSEGRGQAAEAVERRLKQDVWTKLRR